MLPAVDFAKIQAVAQEALLMYGSPATFTAQGDAAGRAVKCVEYRDQRPEALVQDAHSVPALMLLSPADFQPPNRLPQQFDTLTIDIGGFKRVFTIDEANPVFAADKLALLTVVVRAN